MLDVAGAVRGNKAEAYAGGIVVHYNVFPNGRVERAGEAFSKAATESIKAIVRTELEQSAERTSGKKKRR